MYNQKHSCCFTGHRRIRKENIPSINASLESEIEKMVLNGVRHFYCGGAIRTESRAVLSEKRNSRNMMKFYPLQIKSFVFRNIIIAAVCTQETALWLTTATIAYAI